MTLEEKIMNEFEKHIYYRNSFVKIRFVKIRSAFSVEMERKGKKYTCGAMLMMIRADMKKRAERIKKLCLTNS